MCINIRNDFQILDNYSNVLSWYFKIMDYYSKLHEVIFVTKKVTFAHKKVMNLLSWLRAVKAIELQLVIKELNAFNYLTSEVSQDRNSISNLQFYTSKPWPYQYGVKKNHKVYKMFYCPGKILLSLNARDWPEQGLISIIYKWKGTWIRE